MSGIKASEARIALALGRAAVDAILHGTEEQYPRMVRQLFLAGVPVGHKHHDRHVVRSLAFCSKSLLHLDTRKLFRDIPPNMQGLRLMPFWSLECDSVTCPKGYEVKEEQFRFALLDGIRITTFIPNRSESETVSIVCICIKASDLLCCQWR